MGAVASDRAQNWKAFNRFGNSNNNEYNNCRAAHLAR